MFATGSSKSAISRGFGCTFSTISRMISRFYQTGSVCDRQQPLTTKCVTFSNHETGCLHPGLTPTGPLLDSIQHRQTNIWYLRGNVFKYWNNHIIILRFWTKLKTGHFIPLFPNMQPVRFYMFWVYARSDHFFDSRCKWYFAISSTHVRNVLFLHTDSRFWT